MLATTRHQGESLDSDSQGLNLQTACADQRLYNKSPFRFFVTVKTHPTIKLIIRWRYKCIRVRNMAHKTPRQEGYTNIEYAGEKTLKYSEEEKIFIHTVRVCIERATLFFYFPGWLSHANLHQLEFYFFKAETKTGKCGCQKFKSI